MPNYALLTTSGLDQPGIVAAITKVLLDSDCNIEDSQMARLGPDFACMLILRMPENMLSQQLEEKLVDVAKTNNLRLDLQDLSPEEACKGEVGLPKYLIHVYGADRKGIVSRISQHLADNNINIANLHTEVVHYQTPLYVMLIEVEMPSTVNSGKLQGELAAIGKEIEVVVSMKPKPDARF